MQHENIAIIGGGPVGAAAALTLACAGKAVTVIDSFLPCNDGRVLALSYASVAFLEELGIKISSLGTAIDMVHVSHNGLGINNINSNDIDLAHLGYTIKYIDVIHLMYQQIEKYPHIKKKKAVVNNVIPGKNFATIFYDENGSEDVLTADLAILAEGGSIKLHGVDYKGYDYKQQAIIARIKPQLRYGSNNNIAYERFDSQGPMVLLPYEDEFILVWALDNQASLGITTEALFVKLSDMPFMQRFGKFNIIGDIVKFPLQLQVATQRIVQQVALLGSSSQIIHPVSAQGLNLGLRDVHNLCEMIIKNNNYITALNSYTDNRKNDVKFVTGFTHFLVRFLELNTPLSRHLRGLGMIGLSNCKLLQNKLSRSLIFGI